MSAKYTLVIQAGGSLVNVLSLTQEQLDVLTEKGAVILHTDPPTFVKDPKQPNYKAATITKTAVSKFGRKHSKQGRHLNQSVELSREGVEDVVFSKEGSKIMMAKWNIKRPFINRLRKRITGTKAKKMALIRCITETPKRTGRDIEFHSEIPESKSGSHYG